MLLLPKRPGVKPFDRRDDGNEQALSVNPDSAVAIDGKIEEQAFRSDDDGLPLPSEDRSSVP
jgi:hypothetical protein